MAFDVIPAIDLMSARCVRLKQGNFDSKTVYDPDPVEMAKRIEEAGLSRLHIVDLDGARRGRITNIAVLEGVCRATTLAVDFGGGIGSDEEATAVFEAGAAQITVGSLAVRSPELFCGWLKLFGGERIILAADVKDGKVAVNGWQSDSGLLLEDLLGRYLKHGLNQVLCTDISRDGEFSGPALQLYAGIVERFPGVRLIASGGISKAADIDEVRSIGAAGVVVGKALYEGRITLAELRERQC